MPASRRGADVSLGTDDTGPAGCSSCVQYQVHRSVNPRGVSDDDYASRRGMGASGPGPGPGLLALTPSMGADSKGIDWDG